MWFGRVFRIWVSVNIESCEVDVDFPGKKLLIGLKLGKWRSSEIGFVATDWDYIYKG